MAGQSAANYGAFLLFFLAREPVCPAFVVSLRSVALNLQVIVKRGLWIFNSLNRIDLVRRTWPCVMGWGGSFYLCQVTVHRHTVHRQVKSSFDSFILTTMISCWEETVCSPHTKGPLKKKRVWTRRQKKQQPGKETKEKNTHYFQPYKHGYKHGSEFSTTKKPNKLLVSPGEKDTTNRLLFFIIRLPPTIVP